MCVFIEGKLGCQLPQPSRRRAAEVVQLEPGDRTSPAISLVEDGGMRQVGDTDAGNHLCPTVIAKLVEPLYVTEKAQREQVKGR